MQEILVNAISRKVENIYFPIYIERNQCILGDYMAAALDTSVRTNTFKNWIFIDTESNNNKLDEFLAANNDSEQPSAISYTDDMEGTPEETVGIFTIDCLDPRFQSDCVQQSAKERLKLFCDNFGKKTVGACCFIVQEPSDCPGNVTALSEREFDAYLQQKTEKTGPEKFYLELEKIVRESCRNGSRSLTILRTTNVFGPALLPLIHGCNFEKIIAELEAEKSITIYQGDQANVISAVSAEMYLNIAIKILCLPAKYIGHVFNVSSYSMTIMELKQMIYKDFSGSISLNTTKLSPFKMDYHCLNGDRLTYLLDSEKRKNKLVEPFALRELIYRMICCTQNIDYNISRKLKIYRGRLETIKQLEMQLLKCIDTICRENNIRYFATGGTMLGAVRHNSMIPWDDDIDIGMLRADFEKFRQVCPQHLPPEITYERANGESGSHYHFDRIRLKGTYFSTRYSDNFEIPDGVFVDVLVYDPTSDNALLQKLHIRMVSMWSRVINVKWVNRVRKGVYPKLTRIALPVMRLVQWNWFHSVFDSIAQLYRNKKNVKYVIDTMGLYIKKGALKEEWFRATVDMPFGDMLIPVPSGYAECLEHFYGPRWMQMLPVDKRVSGHHIARIDLGSYLYQNEFHDEQRELDIRGELFENPVETLLVK